MSRLEIPKELHQKSPAKAALLILHCLLLWSVPVLLLSWIWQFDLFLLWKIVLSLPLAWMGGHGLLLAGFIGHEGFHFNLHSNRAVSALLGVAVTSPLSPFLDVGFAVSHWNHHRETNGAADPDLQLFQPFRHPLMRMTVARLRSFVIYGTHGVKTALGLPLGFRHSLALSASTLQRVAWFNIALAAIVLGVHVWLIQTNFILWSAFMTVLASSVIVSGVNPYIEHVNTGLESGMNARSRIGWVWDWLYAGSNYHLEHHLYPSVPCYNLPKLHRFLVANGFYETPRPRATSLLEIFNLIRSDKQYGAMTGGG